MSASVCCTLPSDSAFRYGDCCKSTANAFFKVPSKHRIAGGVHEIDDENGVLGCEGCRLA
jgi:hypothetical protein